MVCEISHLRVGVHHTGLTRTPLRPPSSFLPELLSKLRILVKLLLLATENNKTSKWFHSVLRTLQRPSPTALYFAHHEPFHHTRVLPFCFLIPIPCFEGPFELAAGHPRKFPRSNLHGSEWDVLCLCHEQWAEKHSYGNFK